MGDKYFIFLFFFCVSLQAQKLQGTVSDSTGTVPGVLVVVKKKSAPKLIYKYATTDIKGQYSILLEPTADSLTVQADGFSQQSAIYPIDFSKENNNQLTINLLLQHKTFDLNEVVIKNKRPITVKNDTTTYDPDSFKDGSERVVEDLLKKLPGIEVKESGQILYKGKPIKKFLLDGDDLFDSQYVIGSRNIDINMIDKVQAIDKFNENPLLKGLIEANDVAINLKLLKGKSDVSGSTSLGYGIENRYEGSLTGLLVNSANKGFAITGYNNVGMNSSPYDFRSSIQSVEMLEENELIPKRIINEGNFYSQLDSKYHNFNSNFYTSVNFLRKISSKTTFKVNAGFYDDDLKRENNSITTYLLNNETLVIDNSENLSKKPSLYNLNLFIENKSSKTMAWDFSSKFNYQEIDFSSSSLNNGERRNNQVNSYSFFTKQNFNLTKRIDSLSAYKILGIYSKGNSPQNFRLSPGFNLNEEQTGNTVLKNLQTSNFDKEVLKLRVDYIRKFSLFNWVVSANYTFVDNTFNSNLTQFNTNSDTFQNGDFQNNLHYKYHLPSAFTSLVRNVAKKYAIGVSLRSSYYDFNLEDRIRTGKQNDSKFVLSPLFMYARYLGTYSTLRLSYGYNAIAPSEENLFQGIVLTGFRTLQNNEPNFEFIDTHSYSAEYDYNNLFKFNRLRVRLSHNNRKNNYFSRMTVNAENTISTMFFMPTSRLEYQLDVNAEQFIYPLRTYFKFYGAYGVGFDKNVVNESDIRDIENRNLNLNLTITPKITDDIQFENRVQYASNAFFLSDIKSNDFQSVENSSNLTYKIESRLRTKTTFNILIPNLDFNEKYSFWDFEIEWSSKNNKIKYALIGQNLFNQTTFHTIYVTDFSTTRSSYKLLERYVLLKIYFTF